MEPEDDSWLDTCSPLPGSVDDSWHHQDPNEINVSITMLPGKVFWVAGVRCSGDFVADRHNLLTGDVIQSGKKGWKLRPAFSLGHDSYQHSKHQVNMPLQSLVNALT